MMPEEIEFIGTMRDVSLEDTWRRIAPLLPSFGVTRMANVTGLDDLGIPVYVCVRPSAKFLTTAQGKGVNSLAAMISAAMESIELYHAENMLPDIVGLTANDVGRTICLERLSKGRLWSNAHYSSVKMDWVKGFDIVSQEEKLIPFSLLNFDTSHNYDDNHLFANSTNGLASGNSISEALLHSLCEIVERDNTYHFEIHRTNRLIDQSTINHPWLKHTLRSLGKKCRVEIWDITRLAGIPTFKCILFNKNKVRELFPYWAYGTHLNKHIALSRAITEACQVRLTFISGSRDDLYYDYYHRDIELMERTLAHNYDSVVDYSQIESLGEGLSATEAVILVQDKLRRVGIEEIVYYNHTNPRWGIPVVHTVIPQLSMPPVEGWAYDE